MKVLFTTNLPSPYRIDFFNELGKYCDLTVAFERKRASDRDSKWQGSEATNYKAVYLDLKPYKEDRAVGSALKKFVKNCDFDIVVFSNYVSPATISAISYCRRHNKRYYIEYDGGFYKKDGFFKKILKKYLICGAAGHFTTCEEHKKYLISLGISTDKIMKYPFTSVTEADIKEADKMLLQGKANLRQKLSMHEEKIILTVGRFIHSKGFDVLLEAASGLDKSVGVYIVGGTPTDEYIDMKQRLALDNVHFIGFKTKSELKEYYAAADLFVMPTRSDVWGLVVNEAMSFSLPIISTDKCIAALEMVKEGEGGYIVPVDNSEKMLEKIKVIISDDSLCNAFSQYNASVALDYTIEKMARRHMEILDRIFKG